jgi:XTP/dITP diphosphohydrolase
MADQPEIVLASRNSHKVAELGLLLAPYRLLALPAGVALPPEDGDSFEQNALIKARAAAAASGRPALADDSGIVVAALAGEPGIRSARYAGEQADDEQNLTKLLDEMRGRSDRRAAYVCVLAFVDAAGLELVAEGRCEGTLTEVPRGAGGFGYDPAFVPAEYAGQDLTMAEISQAAKDAISHRGAAAAKMLELLAGRP